MNNKVYGHIHVKGTFGICESEMDVQNSVSLLT